MSGVDIKTLRQRKKEAKQFDDFLKKKEALRRRRRETGLYEGNILWPGGPLVP